MIEDWKQRTTLLLGEEKMQRLQNANVLVAGVGGVGSYAAEMLCRAGVGHMTLIDADVVQESNINRQLIALHSTIGQRKVDVISQRFHEINPDVKIKIFAVFLDAEIIPALLDREKYDFIVDAIDTITPKCCLIENAWKRNIKIISSMGAGAKSDITQIKFADVWDTYHCGLSKAVRSELRKSGMRHSLPIVFSTEQADRNSILLIENERNKKTTAGTISYMPAVFGCYLAEYVIKKL